MALPNRPAGRALLLIVAALAIASSAFAQPDALDLQKHAIARIDAFIDHYRKTGDFQSRMGELQVAERELLASNGEFQRAGRWDALAQGLVKLGAIQRMQGHWDAAVPLYHDAEAVAARARRPDVQVNALIGLAKAEASLRQYSAALADARRAVRIADPLSDGSLRVDALDVLAEAQVGQRDLVGAAATLERAIALAQPLQDRTPLLYARLDLADVHLKLGQTCEYATSYEACNREFDRASSEYEEVRRLAREFGFAALAETAEQFLAEVEQHRGLMKSRQAVDTRVEAAGVFHPKAPADVLVTEQYSGRGPELPPAFVEQYRAWARAGATRRFASGTQALGEFVEASLQQSQGHSDAALAAYLKAIDSLERDRSSIEDDAARGTFLEDKVNFYYQPILQLLQRRRFAEAFELVEKSRSRAMADLLQKRRLQLGDPRDQKLYAESAALRERIGTLQNDLFERLSAGNGGQDGQIAALETELRKQQTAHEQLLARIAVEAPKLGALFVSQPISLAALQRAMRDEHFEVLEYLVLDHAVILWHIAADSVHVRNVFLPRKEVMARVAALRKGLEDPDMPFDETVAQEMYLFLVQPAIAWMKSPRLIVIPHEDLNEVPFQVFLDPATKTFFGERFQISYAPSATILGALQPSAPVAGARLFALADPAITAASGEVRGIARLFPQRSQILTRKLPAKAELARNVRGIDLVHLAVHGKFVPGAPMLSYLELGARPGNDGRLTAAEMFGLPLGNARLVVLSACETGEAQATHANEILGPVRALLYAGAGALVVSQWKVSSEATALWMRTFYRESLRSPPAEGARLASAAVRSHPEYRHPFYWAAFVLVAR